MKGKNERGERKKERRGGKKTERGNKGEGEKGKKQFHSRARTRDLPLYRQLPTATTRPEVELHAQAY